MTDYFITSQFVLDLSRIAISYQEENPRFKDTFFTQYSLPFEFQMNANLRLRMGNYTALNATKLKKKYDGYHVLDGRVRKGTLEILSVEGNLVSAQIDSGFEQLPNFEKKLCDLPLLRKRIPDIYAHANEIVTKKYPEVDYNFPKVVYPKDKSQKGWELFFQFINNYGSEGFIRNEANRNYNIMHPMPYLLYVLKTGFADAGYELAGDILTDEDFTQQVLYSNTPYYLTTAQQEHILTAIDPTYEFTTAGTWRLVCDNQPISGEVNIRLKLDNVIIREFSFEKPETLSFTQVLTIDTTGQTLVLEIEGTPQPQLSMNLNIVAQHSEDGNVIEQVINPNIVDLKRAVPDVTFGELVKTIKNWKNYDMFIEGHKLYMNRIKVEERTHAKDFRPWEVRDPKKTFLTKQSYLIKFPEMDDKAYQLPVVQVTADSYQVLNAQEATQLTNVTEIQIGGYCLPRIMYEGYYTAIARKSGEQTIGMIWYDGLHNGQNYAGFRKALTPPLVAEYWKDWYNMRIAAAEYTWSFVCNKNQFRHIALRDTILAYNQRMLIKSINKSVLDKEHYQVEITTIAI
ncbi:hypothetical protein JMN10_12870 [Capnocytophaga genosp. AHN8471]|uniref:Uncharacterized protein n=1 Tax=Capnocytophaga genosp. AHN8471 TaxID=327574 RepID=A0ABS1YTE1_9FLAO|nr:hypothetical protein [Capnocytophaga genosp. AHN8471]MBM0649676.1 hypothetical protein [Capnocytophaga genosp. AHN8471]MBM0663063.1 hypothetical protein [Capnocytophaga genosp. AHN8471]